VELLFAGLCTEASVMLYDGSPFAKDGRILFDYAEKERITHFGTSAKFIDALAKRALRPRDTHELGALRMILSTGSPLAPEGYDYVYDAIKPDVCLSSISGGTDIMGAFADANAILPVYRGELQCRSLGMAVEVFNEKSVAVVGEKGELVCTRPFPSMPLGLWNDRGGQKYHEAYFAKYPNVWTHGDWCELTERGTMVVYGRSDATLNPGGVRIGTAEIYRVVERIEAVEESIAIGQLWPPDKPTDTRVVLFVKLKEGRMLDGALEERIPHRRQAPCLAAPCTRAHRAGSDIPRTKNGKVVELAVRSVVHGMPVANAEALANPRRSIFTGIFPNSLRSWIRCCGAPGAFPVAGRWAFPSHRLHRLGRPRQSARRAVRARPRAQQPGLRLPRRGADAGMPRGCMDVAGRGESEWLEDASDYTFTLYQNDAAAMLARPARRRRAAG